jgi:hypothetical protein
MHTDRTELPTDLWSAIHAETGPISYIEPASAGNHADIAATLHTASGRMFVKAAKKPPGKEGPEVRSLRWEALINPYVTEFAPRLLWQAAAGEWLALGFEHVETRHADYSPGSPDLAILAKTLHALQSAPCPDALTRPVERRWETIADDVTPMAGNSLLHTDVNADNLLITRDDHAFLVDWAFVSRGAAWVELGLLIPWLLDAGHTPAEAEEWVGQFPSWQKAGPASIDLFVRVFAERWRQNSIRNPAPWVVGHAAHIEQWSECRSRLITASPLIAPPRRPAPGRGEHDGVPPPL